VTYQQGWHLNPTTLTAAIEEFGNATRAAQAIGHPPTRSATRAAKLMRETGSPITGAPRVASSEPAATVADPRELVTLRRQLERVSAEAQQLRSELATGITAANALEDVSAIVAPLMDEYPNLVRKASTKKLKRETRHSTPVEMIVYLADWHIGEVINPVDVEGHNEYGPHIASQRIEHIAKVLLDWVEQYGQWHKVDRITFAGMGDMVNNAGLLHPDQSTDYARVLVQALDASLLAYQMILPFAELGYDVRFVATAGGNHGRSNKGKPPFGPSAAQTSWDSVMYEHLAALLRGSGVKFQLGRSYSQTIEVAGHAVWLAHGHAIKGGGGQLGIPAYGTKRASTAAVMASVLEAMRTSSMGRIVKHARVAHFHQEVQMPMPTGTFKICPSIKGTGPWELAALGAVSTPECMFEVFHPEHGIIGSHTVDCTYADGDGFVWGAMRSTDPAALLV
jgi:hypothetical protein